CSLFVTTSVDRFSAGTLTRAAAPACAPGRATFAALALRYRKFAQRRHKSVLSLPDGESEAVDSHRWPTSRTKDTGNRSGDNDLSALLCAERIEQICQNG